MRLHNRRNRVQRDLKLQGRNAIVPSQPVTIHSYITEDVTGLEFPSATVTAAGRTFWEKVTLLHYECNVGEGWARSAKMVVLALFHHSAAVACHLLLFLGGNDLYLVCREAEPVQAAGGDGANILAVLTNSAGEDEKVNSTE